MRSRPCVTDFILYADDTIPASLAHLAVGGGEGKHHPAADIGIHVLSELFLHQEPVQLEIIDGIVNRVATKEGGVLSSLRLLRVLVARRPVFFLRHSVKVCFFLFSTALCPRDTTPS